MKHIIATPLFALVCVICLLIVTDYVPAWTAPNGNPPTGDVAAPINTGSVYQSKLGELGSVLMRSGMYCNAAGSSCVNVPAARSNGPIAADVVRSERMASAFGSDTVALAIVEWNNQVIGPAFDAHNKPAAASTLNLRNVCIWGASESSPTSGDVTVAVDEATWLDRCADVICKFHPSMAMGFNLKYSSAYHNGSGGGGEKPGVYKVDCLY